VPSPAVGSTRRLTRSPSQSPIKSARRADARALHRRLAGALAVLSTADQDALLLVADGLSYQEAAQALGVPPGTLSSRLARARRMVRAELGGVNPADER
jgi:RNA polymerase sigma factor (sigma-70 family)